LIFFVYAAVEGNQDIHSVSQASDPIMYFIPDVVLLFLRESTFHKKIKKHNKEIHLIWI